MALMPGLALVVALGDPHAATLAVDWASEVECGSGLALQARVEEFVSRQLPPELLAGVEVSAALEAADATYELDLRVDTPAGLTERRLEAPDCTGIIDAAAIVVAVALDPLLVAHELDAAHARARVDAGPSEASAPPVLSDPPSTSDDDRSGAAERAPTSTRPPSPPPALAPSRDSRPASRTSRGPSPRPDRRRTQSKPRALDWTALALGTFDIGSLARATGGATLGVAVHTGLVRARVEGTYLGPQVHRPFPDAPEAGVRTQMGEVDLAACVAPEVRGVVVASCFGAQLGIVRGRGVGVSETMLGHELRVALGADLAVIWRFHPRIGIHVRTSGAVAVRRPAFDIVGLGTAWRASPGGFRTLAGFEFSLSARKRESGGK